MAGISLRNNLGAMNTSRMLGLNEAARAKSTEKLSSGYKINRAADDAAGLAISEKMRKLIRGLNQGTENAQDGISWVQTGDGALDETQDILKRMTELSIKALNGTNSKSDRADMQAEFEQLKVELDRIGTTTKFNEMNIFSEHKPYWYQCQGAVKWEPNQMHVVTEGENDLTFKYRQTEDDNFPMTVTVTIPPGEYSTVELLDEIDTAISDSMGESMRVFLEYTREGCVNATLEGGGYMDYVSGGLSYLLYDVYKGGNTGALIGTTIFPSETAKLDIKTGRNDTMTFDIQHFDGRTDKVTMTLQQGRYTRKELINLMNAQLAGTSVKASAYGTGIKLGSPDAIITGFKGNMFRIDGADYTSVFYDNVQYGSVNQYEAVFTGGYILNTDSRDKEHEKIKITAGQNDTLTLQPNGGKKPVSLTLDPGEYTMEGVRDKLNSLFQANQLELKASVIFKSVWVGDKNVTFKGLEIRSEIKGLESEINLDPASSAFDTLFVTRNYNQYGDKAKVSNEGKADPDIWYRGSKNLTAPITITADNDTFKIKYKETAAQSYSEVTIKLPHKRYTTLEELAAEVNTQINADTNSSGKLKAQIYITTDVKHRLQIDGAAGKDIDEVYAEAVGTNKGFDALFQGWRTTVSGSGSVIVGGGITSEALTVVVGGRTHVITFPNNPPSKQEVVDAINKIKGDEQVTLNKFDTVSARGTSWDYHFSASGKGNATVTYWSGSKTGESKKTEGVVGFEYNRPAELELGPELKDQMVIKSNNNTLSLDLNGSAKIITIPEGTYNPQSLRDALQRQIDLEYGTQMGGAQVIVRGNHLTLKSRLPDGEDGADTSIKCSTSDSTFLSYLNTKETRASCTSSRALASSIKIDSSNNKFTFQYTENGSTRNIELTLDGGDYSPSAMVAQLNTQLNKTGTGIQASLSGNNRLVLASAAVGNGVAIEYQTKTAGSAMDALYGVLSGSTPAQITVAKDIENSITIDASSQNFTIIVNGSMETVTLTQGTYSRGQFLAMLNTKLSAVGVEAFLSGNQLGFRTAAKGSNETIGMEYANGGDSMAAIYGGTTATIPGVHAVWKGDNLELTAVDKNGNPLPNVPVSAYYELVSGGAVLPPAMNAEKEPVEQKQLVGTAPNRSKVEGADLASPVSINQWNNDLNFIFTENGTNHNVSITVADKSDYTYQELQKELQDQIDAAVGGTGKIVVTVDAGGVVLTSAVRGSQYRFSSLSGDFYQNVLCKCTQMSVSENTQNRNGRQEVQKAYVVGRKDVVSKPVEINQGISDELSFDLTIDGVVHKIEVLLAPGKYNSNELKAYLQEKIDQACVDMGLVKGLVEVGIGGISSGVAGGNDQKALNFSLSDKVQMPGGGDYIIDGVSGNAAFEVFYQTDGRMIPTYIVGTKDVTKGIIVKPGETELSFCADGIVYRVQLEEGSYTGDELADELNRKLGAVNAPLTAQLEMESGRLKISHKQAGEHDISWVSGSAKDEIFFEEEGDSGDTARYVQLSDDNPDYIELMRSEYSASLIGVNSLCLTGIKYATKSVDRLSSALEKVSRLRSNFGSTQNRLEHAINNNRNKTENLQSAESIIRDTEMAEEMVQQSRLQILNQAGYSMLAQANQNGLAVMELMG